MTTVIPVNLASEGVSVAPAKVNGQNVSSSKKKRRGRLRITNRLCTSMPVRDGNGPGMGKGKPTPTLTHT